MNHRIGNARKTWLGISCIIAISLLNSITAQSQSEFLLTESDMVGYKLQNQFANDWIVGEDNVLKSTIRQVWIAEGANDASEVDVEFCVFNSEAEAITGTAYTRGTYAEFFVWGSLLGNTIGDGSWTSLNRYGNAGTIVVRGNVGVHIDVLNSSKVDELLNTVSVRVVDKINSNLSAEILSFEDDIRQKQISKDEFETITNPVAGLEAMSGFSPFAMWDSKWLTGPESVAMGIRKEWKNAAGAVVGIDICKLDSNKNALDVGGNRSGISYFYDRLFGFDNLDKARFILDNWQTQHNRADNSLFSIVGYARNTAVHVSMYDPEQIDTDAFYLILVKLSEQLSNF